MLKRGGTNPGAGRPTSWLRGQLKQGLQAALPALKRAIRTRKDPLTGEDLSLREWLYLVEVAAKFAIGTPTELAGTGGAPFTVHVLAAVASIPAAAPDETG